MVFPPDRPFVARRRADERPQITLWRRVYSVYRRHDRVGADGAVGHHLLTAEARQRGERWRGRPAGPIFQDSRYCSVGSPLLAALTAYGFPPSVFDIAVMAFCARTLLPASSSGGEMTAMPNLPGDTAMIPPPTPLFAGSPVRYSHFPESS